MLTAAVAVRLLSHILQWDILTAPSRCKISCVKCCLPSQTLHQGEAALRPFVPVSEGCQLQLFTF